MSSLCSQVQDVVTAGADWVHVDVMVSTTSICTLISQTLMEGSHKFECLHSIFSSLKYTDDIM